MTDTSLTSHQFFAEKFGIARESLGRLLSGILEKTADDGEIYFEYLVNEAISLEDGIVKKASKSISRGVGTRAITFENHHKEDVEEAGVEEVSNVIRDDDESLGYQHVVPLEVIALVLLENFTEILPGLMTLCNLCQLLARIRKATHFHAVGHDLILTYQARYRAPPSAIANQA